MRAAPFTAPPGGRAYQAARSALDEAWGRPTPASSRMPRANGGNESLHLATFERARLAEALLLRNLRAGSSGNRPSSLTRSDRSG